MTARIDNPPADDAPAFMSVRQVAQYLQLNEKKIYALLKSGDIPGTKVTGKWLFPRELIDRWVLDSAHGGLLHDRLIVCGGDDPLLQALLLELGNSHGAHALISYSPGGTRLGLELLQKGRADLSLLHWGPAGESNTRHPALLRLYPSHGQWLLLHLYRREAGLMLAPLLVPATDSLQALKARNDRQPLRWCLRQRGSGMQRFFEEAGNTLGIDPGQGADIALSGHDAARRIALGLADCAPGCLATAREHGLEFLPLGQESIDLVLPQGIYFRHLFQQLLERLQAPATRELADRLQGYDLEDCGRILWGG